MESKLMFEVFIEGRPVPQPRDRFRTLLPSFDVLNRRPRDTRSLWHWLVKNCRAASQGVPKEHAVHAWKKAVCEAVCEKMVNLGLFQFDEENPVKVDLVFVHPRPKSKTTKVKPNRRYWHAQTPDIDNMQKAVFDSLNEFAWSDDCIVCVGTVEDFVAGDGDRSGVAIRISELPEDIESWSDSIVRVGQLNETMF